MSNQEEKVKSFFDRISGSYRHRYDASNAFHQYFFQERLQAATEKFDFENKTILDIGAGTGHLYDHISATTKTFQYFACDISAAMFEQSSIPPDNRFVGRATDINFPVKQFDLIYLLGVTTYMSTDELKRVLVFMRNRLSPDGQIIISFTNKNSIDYRILRMTKGIRKMLPLKNSVSGQDFETFAYRKKEMQQLINRDFNIQQLAFLNQTISPFNKLTPRLAVKLAGFFKRNFRNERFLDYMSSDFLILAGKK